MVTIANELKLLKVGNYRPPPKDFVVVSSAIYLNQED